MKRELTFLIYIILMMTTLSCRKSYDDFLSKQTIVIKQMSDMKVSPTFEYKTTKKVSIEVQLPFTIDYSAISGRLDFYYFDSDLNEVIFYSALADHSGYYSGTLEVPAYLEGIYVRNLAGDHYIAFDVGLKSTLEGGTLNYGSFIVTFPPIDTTVSVKSSQKTVPVPASGIIPPKRMRTTEENLVQNGDFSINDFGSISSWESPMVVDGRWYETSYIGNRIGRVSLAGEPVLRFANNNYLEYGGVAQLIEANPGELITFTAEAKSAANNGVSWIYLIPRDASGTSIEFYARSIPQVTNAWTGYTISATMPTGTVSCQVLIWNEFSSGRTVYFDNVVVTGPSLDDDNDGVINEEDDYPNDPLRAYNLYYPDNTQFGTLAFEDNWPQTADYDLNDLVIAYRFKQVLNANTALVELYADFSVRAIGASYRNAFGFEIPIPEWIVQSVSGNDVSEGYLTISANGTEAGQSTAVIFVTDDPRNQLPYPGSGEFVNTSPGAPYVTPDTLNLHITLNSPVALSVAGYAPYNPFIVVNRIRGREIHLVDHTPTALADAAYFGTQKDDSDPSSGRYYKTAENLPWALNIPAPFDYPTERTEIIKGYLKYAEWAMSSGTEYSDWYLPNITGYRDDEYLY